MSHIQPAEPFALSYRYGGLDAFGGSEASEQSLSPDTEGKSGGSSWFLVPTDLSVSQTASLQLAAYKGCQLLP